MPAGGLLPVDVADQHPLAQQLLLLLRPVVGVGPHVRNGVADAGVEPEARKLLSFTDNRQDAALQAGHMNDFVQVVLLRGAPVRALEERRELRFDEVGTAAFGALDLAPELFMKEAVGRGPGYEDARRTTIDLLEYRTLEDLAGPGA